MENTPTPKKLLIVQSSAPFGSSSIQESLDLVLAAGTFDQDVSLLIEDDACYQLLESQNPSLINRKNTTKMLNALPIYGIEKILVCADSMKYRSIVTKNPLFKLVTSSNIKQLYAEADSVIRF